MTSKAKITTFVVAIYLMISAGIIVPCIFSFHSIWANMLGLLYIIKMIIIIIYPFRKTF